MPEANLFLMFTQRLNTLGVAYMVSGSVAVIIYGEPRLTHDVDLIVVLDPGHIARLPEVFPPAAASRTHESSNTSCTFFETYTNKDRYVQVPSFF